MIYTGLVGIPRHPFPRAIASEPIVLLDDASLDALDQPGSAR